MSEPEPRYKLSYVSHQLGIPYHTVLAAIKVYGLGVLRSGTQGYGLTAAEITTLRDALLTPRPSVLDARRRGRPRVTYTGLPAVDLTAPDDAPPGHDQTAAVWYTVADAAQRLRLPDDLVRRYVLAGCGSRGAQGTRWRLARADLDTIQQLVAPARLGQGYLRPFYAGTLLLMPPPGSPAAEPPTWCGPDTPTLLKQAVREAAIYGHSAVRVGHRRIGLTVVDGRPRLVEMDEREILP